MKVIKMKGQTGEKKNTEREREEIERERQRERGILKL
jgi:hypothetical protein